MLDFLMTLSDSLQEEFGQQRVQDQEKDGLFVQDKRNTTRTKDGKHHKQWKNNKNKCQAKM